MFDRPNPVVATDERTGSVSLLVYTDVYVMPLTKREKIAVVLAATLMPPQTKKKRKEWAKLYLKNRDEFSHMKLIKSLPKNL